MADLLNFLMRLLMLLLGASMLTVGPNEVAVIYQRIGGDPANNALWSQPLGPGIYFIDPLINEPFIYSTAPSVYTTAGPEALPVTMKDGHTIHVEISVVYSVDPARANLLHVRWGARYSEDFVRPVVRSSVRDAFAPYTEEEFIRMTEKRSAFQRNLHLTMARMFQENGLFLRDTLLRNVIFTDGMVATIDAELMAQATATARAGAR